jgi:hypothetical protein
MARLVPSSRTGAAQRTPAHQAPHGDFDLVPTAAGLWLVSAARVVLALKDHESFHTEATLALACLIVIPWLLLPERSRR